MYYYFIYLNIYGLIIKLLNLNIKKINYTQNLKEVSVIIIY